MLIRVSFFFYLEMNSFIVTSSTILWLLVHVLIILYIAFDLIYAFRKGWKIIPAEIEELQSITFIIAHNG